MKKSRNNIFFFWDGPISDNRLKILLDCVYSTRVFNPDRAIYVISNTLRESDFIPKYNIQLKRWDISLIDFSPVLKDIFFKHYLSASAREKSDIIRLILLYKYGGSYIDTDDLAIKSMTEKNNIICRSYDPHTCHYNKLNAEDCLPGSLREIRGYDHIPIFPRNDCWQNFEPNHPIIDGILNDDIFINGNHPVRICGDYSFQSLTLKYCKKFPETYTLGLTLIYFYEDFLSNCSYWDQCAYGGEMCDIYKSLKNINLYKWGKYKCDKETAYKFLDTVLKTYPYLSHMWLHSKDTKPEWLIKIDKNEEHELSTWLYNLTLEKI
jgi:hypothetical protein